MLGFGNLGFKCIHWSVCFERLDSNYDNFDFYFLHVRRDIP